MQRSWNNRMPPPVIIFLLLSRHSNCVFFGGKRAIQSTELFFLLLLAILISPGLGEPIGISLGRFAGLAVGFLIAGAPWISWVVGRGFSIHQKNTSPRHFNSLVTAHSYISRIFQQHKHDYSAIVSLSRTDEHNSQNLSKPGG